MTEYFIRFSDCREWLECDAKRGYSFHGYNFHNNLLDFADDFAEYTQDMESEEEIKTFLLENRGIAQNSDGRWGVARPGLCGYGPFETLEEAEEAAGAKGEYLGMTTCGIYAGWSVSDDQLDEVESVFRPCDLVKTFDTSEQQKEGVVV